MTFSKLGNINCILLSATLLLNFDVPNAACSLQYLAKRAKVISGRSRFAQNANSAAGKVKPVSLCFKYTGYKVQIRLQHIPKLIFVA
jgi:hypothetical protein